MVDYVTSGIACGLFGVLLLGLPVALLSVGLYALQSYLTDQGFPLPDPSGWLWRMLPIAIPPSLQHFLKFAGIVLVPVGIGFLYGWWAGMHRHACIPAMPGPPNQSLHRMATPQRRLAVRKPRRGRHR
jgi:hypothetical protein